MTDLPGGWNGFNFKLTPGAKAVFDKALEGLIGVNYTPLAFAMQVVDGTNYCFLCKAHVTTYVTTDYAALVYIYQPLKGDPHIVGITRVTP